MKTATDKRTKSQEGWLLADAVIMQTGPLPYLRGEIGLQDGDPLSEVTLNRSRKAVEESLDTMIGAPVTIGHPVPFIDATDAKNRMVGAIVTKPTIDQAGQVKAKLRIYDQDAIDRIESGVDELSPGFLFVIGDMKGDRGEIDKIKVNHIAIVPKGRAGASVRIMDSLPPAMFPKEGTMNDDMKAAIDEAVAAAVRRQVGDSGAKLDTGALVKAITDSMKPALDKIEEVKRIQDEAIAAAEKKAADEKSEKEKEKLIENVMKDERARYAILDAAKPLIAEDQHAGLVDKTAKEILVLALGDSVKNADDLSIDYLRGKLEGKLEAGSVQVGDQQATPPGVMQVSDRSNRYKNPVADYYKKRHANRFGAKGGSE